MQKNILLTIEYDGSSFHGWQKQKDKRTVQGEIERVLSELLRMDINIYGASRTDKGVHALGQRASLQGDIKIPTDRLAAAANARLAGVARRFCNAPPAVRITKAEEKPCGFHARFSAAAKTYIYRIKTGEPDIFKRNYYWQIEKPLDLIKMRTAAKHFIGTHDFRAFMTTGGAGSYNGESTERTIYKLEINDDFEIMINGNAFLYNMVRIIAGTLVSVGLGKTAPSEIPGIILEGNRNKAGIVAPAGGLYLAKVHYDE